MILGIGMVLVRRSGSAFLCREYPNGQSTATGNLPYQYRALLWGKQAALAGSAERVKRIGRGLTYDALPTSLRDALDWKGPLYAAMSLIGRCTLKTRITLVRL